MNGTFIRIKPENYTTISNVFLRDRRLSSKTKGIMAIIMALPDGWDFSVNGLISIVKEGESAVRSAIKELIDNGYCGRKPVREGNRISKWQYIFDGDGNIEKSLLCGFQQVENLQVENRGQYNNINNNISSINTPDEKEKKEEKNNNKKRFLKPTIQDIAAYIKEKGFHFDASTFFDYYESKGWVVGRSPMKDWKAACRLWESKRKQDQPEEPVDEIPADDLDSWGLNQIWMKNFTPRLADRITYKDFAKMRAMVLFNAKAYAEIIKIIDKSGYDGDIVKEFERICDTHEFKERILV